MIKIAKFIFIFLFLFYFFSESMAADKLSLAYDFKLKDLNGSEVSLSSYKDKKAVVLIFWTTWCPYCREALKNLQVDFKSLDDMGLELLAINVGEPESRVNRFAKSHNFSFKVLLDSDSAVADHYDLLGVPTYVVVNKPGKIVFNGNSFPKDKLKELLAK